MQYVASHTTIPVPRIYAVHTEGNGLIYIEMAYVPGDTLDSAWRRGLSTDEKDTICADIKQHISSLRELQPPAQDIVSSALQNPAFDCRIGAQFYGPMNHDEFQSLVRGHLCMEDVPLLGEEVAKVHTSHYQIRFAHADLAPRNIIVRGGRVAAIIDWAFAGWYPEYWEFTKAHYCHIMDDDWEEFLRLALPCYETELTAEQTLWRRLPQPGARLTSPPSLFTTISLHHQLDQYTPPRLRAPEVTINSSDVESDHAYHWGMIIMPRISQGRDCQVFEATDASEIDPVTLRLKNPAMD
ncbi:hypothetical protein G6O67_007853 [Ophiocordyceps sinensis]|uniref:Aminoglycoside phosphotransferase domain-containing protein n=1 Tax=Ophiocordyceps sinensis TaxID=72228 RepID=A0A8H4PLN8_9HYPO|nr:hypothetical protein G6O67_007853 [Ophiocordyceps sinensis]